MSLQLHCSCFCRCPLFCFVIPQRSGGICGCLTHSSRTRHPFTLRASVISTEAAHGLREQRNGETPVFRLCLCPATNSAPPMQQKIIATRGVLSATAKHTFNSPHPPHKSPQLHHKKTHRCTRQLPKHPPKTPANGANPPRTPASFFPKKTYFRTPATETGTCSTISIPNPCSAGTCVGVFVSRRIL
jgi:hypothetical protein